MSRKLSGLIVLAFCAFCMLGNVLLRLSIDLHLKLVKVEGGGGYFFWGLSAHLGLTYLSLRAKKGAPWSSPLEVGNGFNFGEPENPSQSPKATTFDVALERHHLPQNEPQLRLNFTFPSEPRVRPSCRIGTTS